MKIVCSRIRRVGGRLAGSAGNARTRWSARDALLLELRDEQGLLGLGEAAPLPDYSPDTLADATTALERLELHALGVDETRPADAAVAEVLEKMAGALAASPAARFAVETALFDLIGKRTSRSVAACLTATPRPRVAVSGLVAIGDVAAAHALVARGIRTIKVKVGAEDLGFDRELRLLEALRRALPEGIRLRLDANGAWSPSEARARLAALAPLGVELVEEPTRGDGLVTLGACAVPWAADECLLAPEAVEALLASAACAAVVLKPVLLGGMLAARRIAERAQRRGIGVIVTHTLDGPVGLAAACELALSLEQEPLACGLDLHEGLSAFPKVLVLQRATPAFVEPSGLPGLGIAEVP